MPSEVIGDVRRLLGEIMEKVLQVDLYSKPDYAVIKEKLAKILAVVEGTDPHLISVDSAFEMTF